MLMRFEQGRGPEGQQKTPPYHNLEKSERKNTHTKTVILMLKKLHVVEYCSAGGPTNGQPEKSKFQAVPEKSCQGASHSDIASAVC